MREWPKRRENEQKHELNQLIVIAITKNVSCLLARLLRVAPSSPLFQHFRGDMLRVAEHDHG